MMKEKKTYFVHIATALLLLAILMFSSIPAYGSAEETEKLDEDEKVIPVEDIELGDYDEIIEIGNTTDLSAKILPENATETVIKYVSYDPDIAKVNSSGEVKGLKKGETTIVVEAGEFSKRVQIVVKTPTEKLSVNETYLLMKPGETTVLKASVEPEDAEQHVTFHSSDKNVAKVSKQGRITAMFAGTATIIVSNGDQSVAVSVIVNNPREGESVAGAFEGKPDQNDSSQVESNNRKMGFYASKKEMIPAETLQNAYEQNRDIEIIGDGYTMLVDSQDIVNTNHCLYTDLQLTETADGTEFVLNQGETLCGKITISFEESRGEYLYLYNEAKDKYEQIEMADENAIELTSPGKYLICKEKLNSFTYDMKHLLLGGGLLMTILMVVFVAVKRKYWFW